MPSQTDRAPATAQEDVVDGDVSNVAPTTNPPVSARILKKRETDRRCQRMIRERTKSRIVYLEGLVEQFRQQDSTGQVETLLTQLANIKTERDSLAKKVKNIESIICDDRVSRRAPEYHSRLSNSPNSDDEGENNGANNTGLPSPAAYTATENVPPTLQYGSTRDSLSFDVDPQSFLDPSLSTEPTAKPAHLPLTISHAKCTVCQPGSCSGPNKPLNLWWFANETLTQWFQWPSQLRSVEAHNDLFEDVPVRAVIEGWDSVARMPGVHPLWRLLRGIDETIFAGGASKRERIGVLRTMSLLLRDHVSPTPKEHEPLPTFYTKRPIEQAPHTYAIAFFCWPGIRERFVYSEHRYCNNNFWKLLNKHLHLSWQYELRDCYTRNVDTGLYKISPTFRDRITDIRSWTMEPDFFKSFPELVTDIPVINSLPPSISPARPTRRITMPPHRSSDAGSSSSNDNTSYPVASSAGEITSVPLVGMSHAAEEVVFGQIPDFFPYDYTMNSSSVVPTSAGWGFTNGFDYLHFDAA